MIKTNSRGASPGSIFYPLWRFTLIPEPTKQEDDDQPLPECDFHRYIHCNVRDAVYSAGDGRIASGQLGIGNEPVPIDGQRLSVAGTPLHLRRQAVDVAEHARRLMVVQIQR